MPITSISGIDPGLVSGTPEVSLHHMEYTPNLPHSNPKPVAYFPYDVVKLQERRVRDVVTG